MNDYERIAQAIHFVEAHFRSQPDLAAIAAEVGLSEYHFQRLFKRWAGISPKRFLQYITAEYARLRLAEAGTVLDVAYDAGLSGPGRLHDLTVNIHAMTPGELKNQGTGLTIDYGIHETPFGPCLIGVTARGICWMGFDTDHEAMIAQWPNANYVENPERTGTYIERAFESDATLHVKGTNFQVRVWEALLRIPPGMLTSYETVAQAIGQPNAVRAVGSAVGRNPVAYLIPCHRVIRKSGAIGDYHWGSTRKKAMIGWEAVHQSPIGLVARSS